MKENTRSFLYPGSSEEAAEGEILMKRSSSFPGIFPKIEFTTTSVIEESDGEDDQEVSPICRFRPATPKVQSRQSSAKKSLTFTGHVSKGDNRNFVSLKDRKGKLNTEARDKNSAPSSASKHSPPLSQNGCSRQRNKQEEKRCVSTASDALGYQQPTVSSRARALSPYTHRKMCQLSQDARQRLSHLQLGPHHFRKETEERSPPFLVSRRSNTFEMETLPSPTLNSSRHQRSVRRSSGHTDSSLLGSYRPTKTRNESISGSPDKMCRPAHHSAVRTSVSAQSKPGSPLEVSSCSLRERIQSLQPSPSYWEQIHSRVQRVLQTHKTSLGH
uniref:Spermatogenesis-associated protein 6 N-terminal domain-containing protein n=2 Tax=Gouania willdenowi TaxID=441366 RepID=A0A8C5EGP2_GOUWI